MNTKTLYSLREEASASLECFGYSITCHFLGLVCRSFKKYDISLLHTSEVFSKIHTVLDLTFTGVIKKISKYELRVIMVKNNSKKITISRYVVGAYFKVILDKLL